MGWFLSLKLAAQLGLIGLAGGVLTGVYKITSQIINKKNENNINNNCECDSDKSDS